MISPVQQSFLSRSHRWFKQFTWGGDWTIPLSDEIKYNLYWFFLDGLFATAGNNIYITYLTIYILALGATSQQIGWMSSI